MEKQPGLTKKSSYDIWQEEEGIPIVHGYSIEDLGKIKLSTWKRKGGKGSFINLEGTEGVNDCYICEIEPGGSLKPQKHLFEEMIYVVSGRGATTIWQEGGEKQTLEWHAGSLFSPPLNTWHQHFNGSGDEPARYMAVTSAPIMINLIHNTEFVFKNSYVFKDRYSGTQGYFSAKGKSYRGKIFGWVWDTNFVPDVRTFQLKDLPERGAGGSNIKFELSNNTMAAHISEFPVGTYKKAHRHGPGAHVVIIGGTGYSLMWPEGQKRVKIDWHVNSMFVPPERWFHQHFNTGSEPARYLALRWGSEKYSFGKRYGVTEDVTSGGDQIEYKTEDPEVRKLYETELAKKGLTIRMKE